MRSTLAAIAAVTLLGFAGVFAIDLADTRLVSEPATSGGFVAFAYSNDLWVAGADGTGVRRLTSHPGVEAGPVLAGRGALAFTGRYEETPTCTSCRPGACRRG
jgi:tricorn protease